MADEKIGQIFLALQLPQQINDLCLDSSVQRRSGLIEDDKTRFENHGPGQGNALALTARELVWVTMAAFGVESHLGQGINQ